jgi:hypothetical protein
MSGFVAVYLIVCLNAASHDTCTKLPITDNTQVQADGTRPLDTLSAMNSLALWSTCGGFSRSRANRRGAPECAPPCRKCRNETKAEFEYHASLVVRGASWDADRPA